MSVLSDSLDPSLDALKVAVVSNRAAPSMQAWRDCQRVELEQMGACDGECVASRLEAMSILLMCPESIQFSEATLDGTVVLGKETEP